MSHKIAELCRQTYRMNWAELEVTVNAERGCHRTGDRSAGGDNMSTASHGKQTAPCLEGGARR